MCRFISAKAASGHGHGAPPLGLDKLCIVCFSDKNTQFGGPGDGLGHLLCITCVAHVEGPIGWLDIQQLARGGQRHSTRSNSATYACCQPVLTSSKLCLSSSKVVPRSEKKEFSAITICANQPYLAVPGSESPHTHTRIDYNRGICLLAGYLLVS